jgi:hypothetical protein
MTPNETKLGSTQRTDDQGTYTAFHRTCAFRDCNVELTSRNRAGASLMCKPCAAAKARGSYISKPRGSAEKAALAARRADPIRTKAHSLLNDLLDRPASVETKQALLSLLMTAEIKALMAKIPNVPTPACAPNFLGT